MSRLCLLLPVGYVRQQSCHLPLSLLFMLMLLWLAITSGYISGNLRRGLFFSSRQDMPSSFYFGRNNKEVKLYMNRDGGRKNIRLFGEKAKTADSIHKEEPMLIDCRSDTVTRPTTRMREAMASAIVGDDVFEDDYTVKELEDRVAKMFCKESALYFPTGTMCNLAAIMGWCGTRGAEMILGDKSHIFLYEQGGMSQIAGVVPRTIQNAPDGTLPIDEIENAIRVDNVHFTTTELIALENTHNYCGGRMLSPRYIRQVGNIAKEYGIPLHIDGARIWNAATKLGISPSELTAPADSVSVCLSKGLGAPCGSVLVGPSTLIYKARRARKVLGGGMRQVGIVAAAGMIGLDDYEAGMLIDDHIRAKVLADSIAKLPGFQINVDDVETNIVLIEMSNDHDVTPTEVAAFLEELGVLVIPFGPNNLRLVVHRDITDNDIVAIIEAFKSVATLHLWPRPNATASSAEKQTKKNTAIITTKLSSATIAGASVETISTTSTINEQPNLSSKEGQDDIFATEFVPQEEKGITAIQESKEKGTEEEMEIFFEEAVIHGMSLSDEGFSVILRGLVCDRFIRVIITPYDPMSEGLDQEQPDTPEAVTLLQLLQGIDVESHLSKDHLSSLCKLDMKGANAVDINRCNANVLSLYRAQILHTYTPSKKQFEGLFKLRSAEPFKNIKHNKNEMVSTGDNIVKSDDLVLMMEGDDDNDNSITGVNSDDDDDDDDIDNTVYGISGYIDTYEETLEVKQLKNVDNSVDSNFVTNNQESDNVDDDEPDINFEYIENDSIDDNGNITVFTTRNTARGLIFAEKDMNCKNAFEFIALAIRHNAIIEARSSLFYEEDLSFTAEQLSEYFPQLVEANSEARSSNKRNYNFYDSSCEVDRLQRLYDETVRQGNAEKADIILDKINTLTDEVDGFTYNDEDQQKNDPWIQQLQES